MSEVDAGGPDSNDGMRRGLLTRTVYEILAASGPMRSRDVLAQVAERIEFSERELSTNATGQVRWRTAATVAMSRSTFGGWLTRDDNQAYSLTESGAEALRELSPDELWLEVTRRYNASKRETEAQGVGWEPFLQWAHELIEGIDLDAEERDYKLRAAPKWAAAGSACATGSADWPELLKQAAAAGNFVDPFAQTWLRNRIQDHPDQVRAAFGKLHTTGTIDAIDAFGEELGSWDSYVSPGDRTVFASCTLLGVAPTSFPPYRPALGTRWAERVDETPGSSPGERYAALLSLCDGLLERWGDDQPPLRDRLDAQGLGWVALKWSSPDNWPPMKRAQLDHWREGSTGEVRVDRGTGVNPIMESAAWTVLSAGLRGETSALVGGIRSWSVEAAQDLGHRLTTGDSGRFFERLVQQLEGATDEVRCLAAEFLYIRDAPLQDMKAATKVDRIGTILGAMAGAPALPEPLVAALDDGHAFAGGLGYHIKAPEHLQWLCQLVLHWLEQPTEVVDEALRDPFAFRAMTTGVPKDSPSIRYAVEYIAWPGLFPSIVSVAQRRQIRNGLIADIGKASGDHDAEVTRDLVALHLFYQRKNKTIESWYRPPYEGRWRSTSYAGPRAWLIRPDSTDDVFRWLEEDCVELRDEAGLALTPDLDTKAVSNLVGEGYAHLPPSQRDELATAFHTFLEGVRPQDLVVTLTDEQLMVGTIDEPAPNDDSAPSPLTRPVLWSASRTPLSTLPPKLSAALKQEGHVVDLSAVRELLAELLDDEPREPEASPIKRVTLPPVSQSLADELYMPVAPLQELVELLNRRRQLVVYGPPGTGKTYVVKKLAERLAGAQDPSRVRLVQFHPSYAYEDFFEGFRPVEVDGKPHFALQDGPLKLLAAEAAKVENRDKAYVLIIDELNRANLAKVFGELYFLLEYREETVRLQYRPDKPFSLPDNMFIIGTMNTADRSIALVDAAIRRRFPFYEMHPRREPVSGVLAAFAKRQQVTDDRVELLEELNLAMGQPGHDLHIGPSYLMRDGLGAPGALDLVWRYDILPLLHEHFYGSKSPEAIDQEFGLTALRRRLAQRARADDSPDDADA